MTLISTELKENIFDKLKNIINIEDTNWSNLEIDLKLKIIHNFCNCLKNNNQFQISLSNDENKNNNIPNLNQINTSISIPLKNQRPKKIVELAGINKQSNCLLFEEFRKSIINVNKEFRKKYNSQNKNFCFGNLSKNNYDELINNYNLSVYNFINKNINYINHKYLYCNLISGNQHKLISGSSDYKNILISKINCHDKFINIEFNNNISIQLELYLTSEKITLNIPAKYKILLVNVF